MKNIVFYLFVFVFLSLPAGAQELHSLGDKEAKISMIEYASLTCPHCARFHEEVLPSLKRDYIDKGHLHYTYRDFPLDGTALGAAMLAECVSADNYFAFLDLLYSRQSEWLESADVKGEVSKLASFAGLSAEASEQCLQDKSIYDGVMAERQGGVDEFQVSSTPSLIINGKKWRDDYSFSAISAYLDELLAE